MQQIGCWSPESIKQIHKAGTSLLYRDNTPVDMNKAVTDKSFGLFEREDDWSSCVYFYLDHPVNGLPELAPAEIRTAGLLNQKNAKERADV